MVWRLAETWGRIWTFRDGLAVRLENHGDWTEALEAAELRQ